jgi:hypothetical protein
MQLDPPEARIAWRLKRFLFIDTDQLPSSPFEDDAAQPPQAATLTIWLLYLSVQNHYDTYRTRAGSPPRLLDLPQHGFPVEARNPILMTRGT